MSWLAEHASELAERTLEHLALSFGATLLATIAGVPLGVWATRRPRLERPLLGIVDLVQTIPSLALFGLLLPLPLIGGIGATPAVVALVLYALLPIARTTVAGLRGIDASILEAADGLGTTPRQRLVLVELPLAAKTIVAGVRIAAVTSIGTATIAAAIGAGGARDVRVSRGGGGRRSVDLAGGGAGGGAGGDGGPDAAGGGAAAGTVKRACPCPCPCPCPRQRRCSCPCLPPGLAPRACCHSQAPASGLAGACQWTRRGLRSTGQGRDGGEARQPSRADKRPTAREHANSSQSEAPCDDSRGMVSSARMAAPSGAYPLWKYYPSWSRAPAWVNDVVSAFASVRKGVDSRTVEGLSSDLALGRLRPCLEQLGFVIESGKSRAQKLTRPVLFGEVGEPTVVYEVDGYHPEHRIVVEVEAGRGAVNNADYRDLIRASLMVDADYLVLAMMLEYAGGGTKIRSYDQTRDRIDAIYASERLKLPLRGVLLIGY